MSITGKVSYPRIPITESFSDSLTLCHLFCGNSEEEAIFVIPSDDRVTVIFSTVFRDETDKIFGKVFLQEFFDARRLPSIQSAPQVRYSNREPPSEIRHLPNLSSAENVGYVTFGRLIIMNTRPRSSHADIFLSHVSPLSTTLQQPRNTSPHNFTDPTLQRLPTLSHQMLKSLHALENASTRSRVLEGTQPSEARRGEGAQNSQRSHFHTLIGLSQVRANTHQSNTATSHVSIRVTCCARYRNDGHAFIKRGRRTYSMGN